MNNELYARVRFRARFRCEYCRFPENASNLPFPVDHIISRQHGGETEIDNLALSCPSCNLHKGPNLATIEWPDQDLIPLFHPRKNRWSGHFRFEGAAISGIPTIGRATVRLLQMNSDMRIEERTSLMLEGEDWR